MMKKKAFTLVEIVMTLGILSIIALLIGSMATYSAGRLRSFQLNRTNDALRTVVDTISLHVFNANTKANIGGEIKGIGNIGGNILVTASKTQTAGIFCTYFGLKDERIYMEQNNCDSVPALTVPVTSARVAITVFDFNVEDNAGIPKVEINIKGYDKTTENTGLASELQTALAVDGENIKFMEN